MRVLITGVTSFIGSNVARRLIQNKIEVIGLVRPESRNTYILNDDSFNNLKIFKYSLDNIDDLDIEIDILFHFAWGGTSPSERKDETIQTCNIEDSKKVFNFAKKHGCKRFFFAGSQAEYGNGDHNNPKPVSEYGKAKYAFGKWCEANGDDKMEFVHLRIFSIYGIGDRSSSLINSLIKAEINGEEIKLGECKHIWNYLEINDCVEALIQLAQYEGQMKDKNVDVASIYSKPLKDFINEVHQICGHKAHLVFNARQNHAEGNNDLISDTSFLQEIGFREKVSFRDGIKNIYKSKLVNC